MPKNKNSAGGRPAKNYDPGYAPKRPSRGGPQAGSRSPGHRGYRPETEDAPRHKNRWDADARESRFGDAPRRDNPRFADRDDRGGRGERPARSFDRNDRNDRNDRGGRSFDRDERAPRSFDRNDRNDRNDRGGRGGERSFDRNDRNDRGGRSFDRDERAPRSFDRNDRNDRNDRGGRGGERSFDRNDRNDRGGRSFDRDDRAPRSFDRNDRNDRNDRGGRGGERSFDRNDRPARSFDRNDRNDRGARGGERTERPAYRQDRGDRPSRFADRDLRQDRPARHERSLDQNYRPTESKGRGDRPVRSFERNDRHSTNKFTGAPRTFDSERAPRKFDRNDRPNRDSSYVQKPSTGAFMPADDVVLERLEAEAIQATDVVGVTFKDLGLGGNIVNALIELGAPTPFPIQAATIPDVLSGRDVLGRGRTGSGKTIAFGAPLVERLMENGGGKNRRPGRKPRALIMAPTRELALQIDRTVQPIARSVGLFTTQIYGGVPQGRQVGALQRGVDIIVGTPGRIEDLIEQGRLDLSEVVVTVLDEADHMCDLGFLEPVQRIIRNTAEEGQKLLFSATLDKGVAKLVDEFLENPSVHEVAGEDQASSTIDHRVLVVEHRDKDRIIEDLANRDGKTLIFSRTRAYAERLTDQLEDAGIRAVALHGDLNQARRTRNLAQLTSGKVNVLVATDVAARGIHVDDMDLVVQADAPDEYKTYTHRAGRTGRAGKEGVVVTLIPRSRRRRMEELLGRAEIQAEFVEAQPGDDVIDEIAGNMSIKKLDGRK